MAKKETSDFLRLMNQRNEAIASRETEEAAESSVGMDPVRLQREAERRERLGTLRANVHPSKKGRSVRNVFGYTDLS